MLAAVLAMPVLPTRAEDMLSAESVAELQASAVVSDGTVVTLEDLAVNLEGTAETPEAPAAAPEGAAVTPETPAMASEAASDTVIFNTGSGNITIGQNSVSANDYADDFFAEDGSYTIQTELNAFFPYEVQFTYNGETSRQWFMTPDSSVEIGGHTFYVNAASDGTMVTQMSLEVGGDTIVVYPEEKEFPENGVMPLSLLPIEEVYLGTVDLSGYTPVELTQVSIKAILGNKLADGDMVAWTKYFSEDNYTVSQAGDKINLSEGTYYGLSQRLEMIVGSGDQLDADAVRYILYVQGDASREWLLPTIYAQNEQGIRTALPSVKDSTYFHDYRADEREMDICAGSTEYGNVTEAYVSLKVNQEVFSGDHPLRAYEGRFETAAEAMAAAEITDRLFCPDMTQVNAGYLLPRHTSDMPDRWITLVSFDNNGNVTGCMPMMLELRTRGISLEYYRLCKKDASGNMVSVGSRSSQYSDQCRYYTYSLDSGDAVNGTYYQKFRFTKDGVDSSGEITGAYIGLYNSMAEAAAAGAKDVKSELFSEDGYGADYSQGVYFTIFYGGDGAQDQMIWKYCVKTEAAAETTPTHVSNDGTQLTVNGLKKADGSYVNYYPVSFADDSYGEYNFLTFIVDKDVTDKELSNLALEFSLSAGAKLYTAGSSTEEISGESFHDFTRPVQYTVSAENGENAKNYWIQVIRAAEGAGQLYINSLADPDADTQVKDGVIYSTREVMLDSYHNDVHDILLANMGTNPIEKLSAELVSDTVELDEYWTLKGQEDLLGYVDLTGKQPQGSYSSYGELWNLAKIRLTAKEGVAPGTDVSGTLTIKSAGQVLAVLKLTGTVGNPSITTAEIPEAVVYVPYGTMIQNSNKYSWNKVSYELDEGALPAGMIVKPNGEIYGVPREQGEFTFTVRMDNSYSSFGSSSKTFTLVVNENTDANVDGSTDSGYDLTQRVQYQYSADKGNQLMVSQGVYAEFVDLYLDGVKLTDGVDYASESGSTRITIYSQTLTDGMAAGTHTLGIEFRTQDTDTLKRAAQNYVLSGSGSGHDDDEDDNDDGGDSSGNSGSGAVSQSGAADTHLKYTVVKGDTLSKIARKNGISLAQLLAWNSQIKNPNLIYPGQIIVIGYIQDVSVAALTPEGAVFDEVMKGDCLYKIARRNGVTLKAIIDLNPEIAKQKYIYPGQKIRIK